MTGQRFEIEGGHPIGGAIAPAGNKNAEATEILRSERTASLLKSLAADPRRIVLIDAPPLLVTSEAGVLTTTGGEGGVRSAGEIGEQTPPRPRLG